ncbi:GTP cyclohydrolase 1 feedback regulatory protein-like isoform X2 [Biomphalaria glabrata]|uniref:GTP cyclohydrolase 1 feedback regulatory protein n=1 Tax=Biomphalaria glabrata TaxID=6526 RepID=A0A9W2ZWC6_BIOGL|nr:GTP cyclohydrolase 1 feedback regulatory protein-like isoform X2 [Biomphalaria glabrata]
MPYVIISTQVRLDIGPTVVGDEWSDPELMEYLDAALIKQLGNNYAQWRTNDAPRVVLEKLELRGYKLAAMAGVGQTCIWTLHKEPSLKEKALSSSSSDAFESPKIEYKGDL